MEIRRQRLGDRLRELTPARVALGHAGHALPTRALLEFQMAHAKARDAVWRTLDPGVLKEYRPMYLRSAARDRATYLRRPDLGRRLETNTRLERGDFDVAMVVADGLSATAVHHHAGPVLENLLPMIADWRVAICVVEQGRVAIGDEIGEKLGAKMVVVLIGERPGLSSPDSLGAYLTWAPRVGRTDAERNCVSNIRTEGLPPELAAQRIAGILRAARARELTGVDLNFLP
jgi:ethanolamine ammonia-lyase small subunit